MPDRFVIGTVGDAAERYRTDVAAVWAWITSGRVLTNPDGERVRLIADPEKRIGGSLWQIEEATAAAPLRHDDVPGPADRGKPKPQPEQGRRIHG